MPLNAFINMREDHASETGRHMKMLMQIMTTLDTMTSEMRAYKILRKDLCEDAMYL